MRSREILSRKTKIKLCKIGIGVCMFFMMLKVAENNTNSKPYTFVTQGLMAMLDKTAGSLIPDAAPQVFASDNDPYGETRITVGETTLLSDSDSGPAYLGTGPEPGSNWTQEQISNEIGRVFGPQHIQSALNIIRCESGFQAGIIGDKSYMFIHNGEQTGDSVGLFQIKLAGQNRDGSVWDRAAKYGMTASQFREALKDPAYNISVAYDVFVLSNNTWGAWSCSPY